MALEIVDRLVRSAAMDAISVDSVTVLVPRFNAGTYLQGNTVMAYDSLLEWWYQIMIL